MSGEKRLLETGAPIPSLQRRVRGIFRPRDEVNQIVNGLCEIAGIPNLYTVCLWKRSIVPIYIIYYLNYLIT